MTALARALPFRQLSWLLFSAAIAVAWFLTWQSARDMGVNWLGQAYDLCLVPMDSFVAIYPMWAIMMAAMMLPTMVPALRTYGDLTRSAGAEESGLLALTLGYLVVWSVFSAGMAVLQIALIRADLLNWMGALNSSWLVATLLLIAGGYQFTRFKETCHSACVAPAMFFIGN